MAVMKIAGLSLLIWVSQILLVMGEVHYYSFVLKEKTVTKLCETKNVLMVNGRMPGPTIYVHKGDTVYVNVTNEGYFGVTLHWHGVKQPRNPWSDGPEFITQCAISPGESMEYEVIFSDEEGTLWWHAHSDWTRASIYGAIVIYPKEGTTLPFLEPDGEEIIMFGSWYNGSLHELLDEDMANGDTLPVSYGYTLNGEAGDFNNCSDGTTTTLIMVEYGKTYQFRVINAIVNSDVFFAIADHSMMVVGMDGAYLKPFNTSYLLISPGQTIDILLTTNQPLGHYYMAFRQFSSENMADTGFNHYVGSAILVYRGSYNPPMIPVFPSTLPYYFDMLKETEFVTRLRSLANKEHPVDVPKTITLRMFVTVSMNSIVCPNSSCSSVDGNKIGTSLNNASWVNKDIDVLSAYYSNISEVFTEDFPDFPPYVYNFTKDYEEEPIIYAPEVTKVKVFNYNESVEIVFQGTNIIGGSANHPMHLHGHSFYVVGRGVGNFDNKTDPKTFNLVDPPLVNTFSVPKEGWLAIRFRATNPGVWFLHCHFDRHMSWGMDTAFIVRDGGTLETSMRPRPIHMPSCMVNNLKKSTDDFEHQPSTLVQ